MAAPELGLLEAQGRLVGPWHLPPGAIVSHGTPVMTSGHYQLLHLQSAFRLVLSGSVFVDSCLDFGSVLTLTWWSLDLFLTLLLRTVIKPHPTLAAGLPLQGLLCMWLCRFGKFKLFCFTQGAGEHLHCAEKSKPLCSAYYKTSFVSVVMVSIKMVNALVSVIVTLLQNGHIHLRERGYGFFLLYVELQPRLL